MSGIKKLKPALLRKHLISPFVDNGHVDVINEDGHPASTRRSVSAANSFLNVTLYRSLQWLKESVFKKNKAKRKADT